MANPHPPPLSTGIDATDVDEFLQLTVLPVARQAAALAVDAALDVLKAEVEKYTPDQIDLLIEQFAAGVKKLARSALEVTK